MYSTSVTTAFVVIALIYLAKHNTIQQIMQWAQSSAGSGKPSNFLGLNTTPSSGAAGNSPASHPQGPTISSR
jgi:hypothetical protein